MTKEGAALPPPEARYNPRAFLLMATDHDYFKAQMPRSVTEIADMDNVLRSVPLLDRQRSVMQELLVKGPLGILDVIYYDFARKQEWLVDPRQEKKQSNDIFPCLEVTFPLPQKIETLNTDQRKMWDTYRNTGEVPREVACRAFSLAVTIHFDRLPSVRYSNDPAVIEIDARLRKAPFQIAHRLFPDLTDEEARKLFGNRTAEDIRTLAKEANQNGQ